MALAQQRFKHCAIAVPNKIHKCTWQDCVPIGSYEENFFLASVNPEFGTALTRRLNQNLAPATLQSNLIAIKFSTAEAQRLNWALGTLKFSLFHTRDKGI